MQAFFTPVAFQLASQLKEFPLLICSSDCSQGSLLYTALLIIPLSNEETSACVTEPRQLRAGSRPLEPGLLGVSPQYAAHQQKDTLVVSNVFLIMYFTLFSLHFDCTPQIPAPVFRIIPILCQAVPVLLPP